MGIGAIHIVPSRLFPILIQIFRIHFIYLPFQWDSDGIPTLIVIPIP